MGTLLPVTERSAAVLSRRCVLFRCKVSTGLIFSKNEALRAATSELRELLERFANGHSMDGIFDACHVLIDDARRDEEFKNWFRHLNTYMRKVSVIHEYPAQHTYGCVGLTPGGLCA